MPHKSITILVTDGTYKQTTGLVKDILLHKMVSDIYIHVENKKDIKHVVRSPRITPVSGNIIKILDRYPIDFVIPVGAKYVALLAKSNHRNKAILPNPEVLNWAFDKLQLGEVLSSIGINYPRTSLLSDVSTTDWDGTSRFVLKSRNESHVKNDPQYFDNISSILSSRISKDAVLNDRELIIQEHVTGIPIGYFAFAVDGVVKCEFMHKRIRQTPPSGGASTCAETYYDAALSSIGKTFVNELDWNGPVMLEFLFDIRRKEYILIEVNPKYWGSLQLAIAAGAHFGQAHICSFFKMQFSDNLEKKYVRMVWPLDGDLSNILKTRNYFALLDYTKKNTQIIWGNNLLTVFYKIFNLIKAQLKN